MRAMIFALCLLASPALADVVGIASVIDGDTIEVHGQRIRLHGIDAPIHAAMRADAMLEKGDMDGDAVWKRILRTVEELQGAMPSAGAGHRIRSGHLRMGAIVLPNVQYQY